jgi:hypothetical protein
MLATVLDQVAPDAGQRRHDADTVPGEFVHAPTAAAHQHEDYGSHRR